MVICLERGADLHMAQLMPLPLTVSCFSKIQIGFTFLVLAHPCSPGKRRFHPPAIFYRILLVYLSYLTAFLQPLCRLPCHLGFIASSIVICTCSACHCRLFLTVSASSTVSLYHLFLVSVFLNSLRKSACGRHREKWSMYILYLI